MYITIENQNDFYPGYPLIKRSIYYGCRAISSQYGTVFSNSHYEKLEKVYGIWICTAPPKYLKNSINLYCLGEHQLYGTSVIKKEKIEYPYIAQQRLLESALIPQLVFNL